MNPQDIANFLQQQHQQHTYRKPRLLASPQQPHCIINGRSYLAFCSNDYLGLANHPNLIHAFKTATDHYGVGTGSAHLINGHTQVHHELEEALADFTGRERALLFSTGYMANLGVITALTSRHDYIYQDKLNHASLLDAAKLSDAKLLRFPHNNTDKLKKQLQQQTKGDTLIAVDGVFSMDGDKAPVKALADLAQENNAWLMVDDAHGMGVLGEQGAGVLEEHGISQQEVPILMGTLGKAFGTAGAFVAGSNELIEYLIQTARSWIYTTAMPAAIAAATLESLKIVKAEAWRREHLRSLVKQFRQGAEQIGLSLAESDTPIQPVIIGDNETTLKLSQRLDDAGILVTAIRPPTVPQNTARLRITFSASHTEKDVQRLLDAFSDNQNQQLASAN
jgi:8-amino-7-oxononanoate synthase